MSELVCITGATGNLGKSVARMFLHRGCRVLLQSRSQQRLDALVQQLQSSCGCDAHICAIVADVTTEEGRLKLARVCSALSGTDRVALVHLVGEFPRNAEFSQLQSHELTRIVHINALSGINTTRILASQIPLHSVVLFASIGAHIHLQHRPHYRLSKMLVKDAASVLSRELAPNIRVNSVSPGAIFVDSPPAGAPPETRIPLARYGKGNDIAEAVWFLTKQATYVTGQDLVVDGGLSL